MGCASSKKRTMSVDDLTGVGDKSSAAAKKNGQLASNDATKHKGGGGDASKAIQIPGAHTSFMAPDGIPFIDEDVPDEDAVAVRKPDVNRNVVQAPEQAKPVQAAPAVTVLPEEAEDKKKDEIGAEIMQREIEMTQQNTTTTTTGACVSDLLALVKYCTCCSYRLPLPLVSKFWDMQPVL